LTDNIRAKRRFCSKACFTSKIDRTCKECGKAFQVPASVLSGKTNASANFCCRPCYENWLCRTNPDPSRGYGWRQIRLEARRLAPFCAYCGTTKGLQVHHIIPYRLTADNAHDNLIPLCRKHHKSVETDFLEMERAVANGLDAAKQALGSELRARQAETRKGLSHAA
jgi:5-methylcytosine-specific restriction endonuclease McrA